MYTPKVTLRDTTADKIIAKQRKALKQIGFINPTKEKTGRLDRQENKDG